jgi:prenyltransferase beta subunit
MSGSVAALWGAGALPHWVWAQRGQAGASADLLTPEIQAASDRGLAWLAQRQAPNGSFDAARQSTPYRRNAGVVSLAGMAFMSAGSTPGRGPFGLQVDRALVYILEHCQDNGFITVRGAKSHGPMYEHGFATMFLAECYGMSMRSDLEEKLQRAVDLIIRTQNDEGGWRYEPEPRDADISVTICQVMALRAARNAGIYVPPETIDRSVEYLRGCQNPDGGFSYMIRGGESAFPRSAAGVVALFGAGIYEGEELTRGLDYLMRYLPRGTADRRDHYYYAQYYAAQAMWFAGGEYWQRWYPAIAEQLLRLQHPDGYWSEPLICDEYATAMACITLQMPNNYLPIFQR